MTHHGSIRSRQAHALAAASRGGGAVRHALDRGVATAAAAHRRLRACVTRSLDSPTSQSDLNLASLPAGRAPEVTDSSPPYADLLDAPPPAAIEAVELCDRLPLALGIAGGMIGTLGTSWEAEICALLKEELEEASIEERVVTASLRVVPEAIRPGVEGLFTLLAVFPEECACRSRAC